LPLSIEPGTLPGAGPLWGPEQGVGKSSWPLPHRGEEVSSAAGIPARICSFWQASGVRWSSTMDAPPGPRWCGITLYRWSRREGEVVLLRRAWDMLLVTPYRTYVLIAEWPCKGASDSGGRNPAGETTPCGPPLPRGDGRLFCRVSFASSLLSLVFMIDRPQAPVAVAREFPRQPSMSF
jgi:hypothetical protein